MKVGQFRRFLRGARVACVLAVTALVIVLVSPSPSATAQSPTPTWFMEDSYPGNGFPAPANAIIIEGLGTAGCSYTMDQIVLYTVYWINAGYQTVSEISPQSVCASVTTYEWDITYIRDHVVQNAPNHARYWGGFMLDEEPGFGLSVSQLQTLNQYVIGIMGSVSPSWVYTENQPNGWTLANYNSIIAYTWPAPQVYTQSMANSVNSECSTYGYCNNLVTIDTYNASPWNSPSYVTGLISGTAWTFSTWNGGRWYNLWRYG